MKNYICTSKGFVKGLKRIVPDSYEMEVEYTDKVRDAQAFNTKAANKFMENHGIEGFVWKPYNQEAIRNMYVVKKSNHYGFMDDDETLDSVEEWKVEKAFMASESDINFLTSKKLTAQDMMSFDEAKAEALRRNLEMVGELNEKINNLIIKTEE